MMLSNRAKWMAGFVADFFDMTEFESHVSGAPLLELEKEAQS
jgi:hypothetical protein